MSEAAPYASIEKVPDGAQGPDPTGVQGVLLEAKLTWGRDTIAVRHVRPRARVRIRDVGSDVPGAPDLVIAREMDGAFVLCLPNGTVVPEACRMTLRMGRAALRVSLVPDDVEVLPPPRRDRRVAFGIIGAAALHLVVLLLVAHGRAPAGEQEQAALETMQRMLVSAEERALEELASAKQSSDQALAEAPVAVPAAPDPADRAGAPHAGHPRAPRPARDDAATFGILSLVGGPAGGTGARGSAFAVETGPAALGSIFSQTIHDVESLGGLGLSSAGEGGGGLGAGVPLSTTYPGEVTRTSP